MFQVMNEKSLKDLNGVFFYLFTELISLNFLIPVLLFFSSIFILIKKKSNVTAFLLICNVLILFLIIVFKLATFKSNYPVSQNIEFYMEGAFLVLWMLIIPVFFFWINRFYPLLLQNNLWKTITVCIIIFYTSGILKEGIKHKEYNNYIASLTKELHRNFEETIFIIDENYIPPRFSKLNMNIEYETLLKSNLQLGESLILFVTAHPTPETIDNQYPVFINSLSPLETSREINFDLKLDLSEMKNTSKKHELKYFKEFNPTTYFKNYNKKYFKFRNYKYLILDKKFMSKFNQKYGFSISDYYY